MDRTTTKLAIVFDDHSLFSDSYSSLIEKLDIFDFVYAIYDEEELFGLLIENTETQICLFLGYYIKNRKFIELIEKVRYAHLNINVVVVSSVINPLDINKILAQGPNGLISKISGSTDIIECLDSIASGKQFVSPELCEIIARQDPNEEIGNTDTELEILKLFSAGFSIAQIADEMMLAKHIIVGLRRRLMIKANVDSTGALLTLAREMKII